MKTVKTYSPKTKILSLILSFLIIFYLVPNSVFAEGLDSETTVSDSSVSVSEENNTYAPEIYEVTELREANVKHFRLEDGSYVAAQYNYPVHYIDESGQLVDIDNRLVESGSELSTDNSRVKFVKKITGNGNIFTIHENNTKITMGLVGAEKKTQGVVISTNNSDDAIEDALGKMTNLENISSNILYEDILDGVDIEYIVHSLNIKENIIVKERKENYSYTFTLELNNLVAELSDDRNVYIRSADGEVQYVIPAPVVFDSNGNYAPTDVATYTLISSGNGKYELCVTVSSTWMNEEGRAFPVTVDPPMMSTGGSVLDFNIDSNSPNNNTNGDEDFYVSATERAYLKFNENYFADIPVGASIMKAELNIIGGSSSTSSAKIGAYAITTPWDSTLTWNKAMTSNYPGSFSNTALDYVFLNNGNGRQRWDITELYKSWLSGAPNYGVGLRLVDETANESASFTAYEYCPSDDDINLYEPVIMVTYIYNDGLEGYYPTSTHSAGVGGVGSINLSTGKMVLAIPTLTTTDSLFGFTPTLVYNSSLAGKAVTSAHTASAFSTSYVGYGFKLNLCETIVKSQYKDADGINHNYYLLYDADGTVHRFYSSGNTTVYNDDDGLQLTLTINNSSIEIKDKSQTTKIYSAIDSSSWYLTQIKDKNNNSLIFEYNPNYKPTRVLVQPNGLSSIEMLRLLYNGDKLCAVYNDSSKDSAILRYSGNNLVAIQYCYGNANTIQANVEAACSNPNSLTNLTVYATATYSYDNLGNIVRITDNNSGKSLWYEITSGKITKISEYAGTTLGQQASYGYYESYTDLRSTGNDEVLDTADDIINRYVFDNFGRSVSAYSMSTDGTEIYGATSGTYDSGEKSKNSIKSSVILGGIDPQDIIVNEESDDGHFVTIQGGIDKTALTGCYNQIVFSEENVSSLTESNANREYIISGFGYSNSIIPNGASDFSIGVNVYYYQGENVDDAVVEHRFSFADVENVSQFICGKFNCKLESTETVSYEYVSRIEVICSYYGQINIGFGDPYACFDNIALTDFTIKSGYDYSYNTQSGNLESKENSLYQEWYTYDEENRIERIENSYGEAYEYQYVEENDKTVETEKYYINNHLLSEISYTSNAYGLLTEIKSKGVAEGDQSDISYIKTQYEYYTDSESVIFGALSSETDSLGNVTSYLYDYKGRLIRQVNNSANSGYYYDYNDDGTLKLVTPYPAQNNNNTVQYSYCPEGYLDKISTQSTTYNMQYDEFGNASVIKAGDYTLATYEYYPNNGKLKKINYGNGFSEEYVYNTLEMLSEICYTYDDGTTVTAYSYTYNHDGTLARIDNHLDETSTEYRYDNRGRLTSIRERDFGTTAANSNYSVSYDDDGNIFSQSNIISYASIDSGLSILFKTTYEYGSNGSPSCENHLYLGSDHKISYTYDSFNRLSSVNRDFGAFDYTTTYEYLYDFDNGVETNNTSYLVSSYTSRVGSSTKTYYYDYDSRGNITSVNHNDTEIIYTYDKLGQLTKESDGTTGRTYTYDNAGNIISIKSEPVSSGGGMIIRAVLPLPSLSTEKTLAYTDSEWGDLLTSFNGHTIIYDGIGNPISYYNGSAYTFTWTGRQLTSAVKGSKTMSFTYDDEGIRTSKTVNGVTHTYQLNGSQIVAESWGDKLVVYLYDASGSPIGMMYRTTSYAVDQWDVFWFEKNLQGDIVAVYNESSTKVAAYTYIDAWGNHSVSYTNGGNSTGAIYNPFRYRGYYYDTDLGMYYLQSRYYDPNTCRFINADSALYHSMLGYNMFAYCMNNPVIMIDITGQYCVDIMDDDGNPLNDWLFDGASSGGYGGGYGGSGYYIGPGSAYYNYSVRSLTAAYDARLGGYHSNSVSSGITNTGYYFVPCAVSVTDDMAVNNYTSRGSTGRIEPQNLKEKLAMEQVQSNPLCGARQLPITMTDPRWPSTEGWVKMSSNVNDVEIHFVFNKRMGVYDDFKFK